MSVSGAQGRAAGERGACAWPSVGGLLLDEAVDLAIEFGPLVEREAAVRPEHLAVRADQKGAGHGFERKAFGRFARGVKGHGKTGRVVL